MFLSCGLRVKKLHDGSITLTNFDDVLRRSIPFWDNSHCDFQLLHNQFLKLVSLLKNKYIYYSIN